MRSSERETLARHILKASSADATSVLVSTRDAALARFSRAAIHQHVAGKDTSVSVRAVIGKRSGVAGTNRLDDTSLASLVR
ncbi:MAG: PmbA/TldA family metallopeptidase, partial [Bacillati bacterium]